jgi:hypothetical protein
MHVIAHDPYASADRARAIGVELVGIEETMKTADFISLHMPLTPATNKMLNDEAFAKMKKGVRIINVARGGVIDEDALVRALDAGIVAQVRYITPPHALMVSSKIFITVFPSDACMFSMSLYRLPLMCSLKSLRHLTASWSCTRMLL